MSKTELLAIVLAVNGGLWLLAALIDWIAIRMTQYRAPVTRDRDLDAAGDHLHHVPPAHAH